MIHIPEDKENLDLLEVSFDVILIDCGGGRYEPRIYHGDCSIEDMPELVYSAQRVRVCFTEGRML